MTMPTPDFVTYPTRPTVTAAEPGDRCVTVTWEDGVTSRFHHVWLRDNCPCPDCVNDATREQKFEIVSIPADNPPTEVCADELGRLVVVWSFDGHVSAYHPGWLRAHRYDDVAPRPPDEQVIWDASTPGMPPTFDGPAVLADDDALLEWLVALRTYGVTRLRNVPVEHDSVQRVAARIGTVRDTNFGLTWDVRSEAEPISNAYTALPLPPHVDLATREYQPGLQFLHCMENTAGGGLGVFLDGFRVAEIVRDEHPDAYKILTTVPWEWANRSPNSDYRWSCTPFVLDRFGRVVEVRIGNWLRTPLKVHFDEVEDVYAAYRTLFDTTYRHELGVEVAYEPGDLMAFDNRRALHGRRAFTEAGGRFLRGCYSDRDELRSRISILERRRAAAGLA